VQFFKPFIDLLAKLHQNKSARVDNSTRLQHPLAHNLLYI